MLVDCGGCGRLRCIVEQLVATVLGLPKASVSAVSGWSYLRVSVELGSNWWVCGLGEVLLLGISTNRSCWRHLRMQQSAVRCCRQSDNQRSNMLLVLISVSNASVSLGKQKATYTDYTLVKSLFNSLGSSFQFLRVLGLWVLPGRLLNGFQPRLLQALCSLGLLVIGTAKKLCSLRCQHLWHGHGATTTQCGAPCN